MALICQHCGKDFTAPLCFAATKFCSKACYLAGVARPVKKCEQCGGEFIGWERKQRFCSSRCRGLSERAVTEYITSQGYRTIYIDAKPYLEHRVVMERILGRPLLTTESVHHKDGNRLNNDPANLELWDRSQPAGQRIEDKIAWCIEFLKRHGVLPQTVSFHEVS